jgi:hypothetical protein
MLTNPCARPRMSLNCSHGARVTPEAIDSMALGISHQVRQRPHRP